MVVNARKGVIRDGPSENLGLRPAQTPESYMEVRQSSRSPRVQTSALAIRSTTVTVGFFSLRSPPPDVAPIEPRLTGKGFLRPAVRYQRGIWLHEI